MRVFPSNPWSGSSSPVACTTTGACLSPEWPSPAEFNCFDFRCYVQPLPVITAAMMCICVVCFSLIFFKLMILLVCDFVSYPGCTHRQSATLFSCSVLIRFCSTNESTRPQLLENSVCSLTYTYAVRRIQDRGKTICSQVLLLLVPQ
jgi:hypothetical protein